MRSFLSVVEKMVVATVILGTIAACSKQEKLNKERKDSLLLPTSPQIEISSRGSVRLTGRWRVESSRCGESAYSDSNFDIKEFEFSHRSLSTITYENGQDGCRVSVPIDYGYSRLARFIAFFPINDDGITFSDECSVSTSQIAEQRAQEYAQYLLRMSRSFKVEVSQDRTPQRITLVSLPGAFPQCEGVVSLFLLTDH